MRVVTVLSLDVGAKTGWAVVRKHDREVLGCGDVLVDDLGCALDLIVRWLNMSGYAIEAVIERMPVAGGIGGDLSTVLEYARKTTEYWLGEVFEVPTDYVLPGTWKTSRVAATSTLPRDWNGRPLSQHQKDAIMLAWYYSERSRG